NGVGDFQMSEDSVIPALGFRSRSGLLILGMLMALVAIAALSAWDVKRRTAESLEDFGQHQARLARSIASHFESRALGAATEVNAELDATLIKLRKLEEPGTWVVLLWPPAASGFLATSGQPTQHGLLKDTVQAGRGYTSLPGQVAATLGLPRRTAVVG